eukprot:5392554-Pleurochrysis_carterae.AAC.3
MKASFELTAKACVRSTNSTTPLRLPCHGWPFCKSDSILARTRPSPLPSTRWTYKAREKAKDVGVARAEGWRETREHATSPHHAVLHDNSILDHASATWRNSDDAARSADEVKDKLVQCNRRGERTSLLGRVEPHGYAPPMRQCVKLPKNAAVGKQRELGACRTVGSVGGIIGSRFDEAFALSSCEQKGRRTDAAERLALLSTTQADWEKKMSRRKTALLVALRAFHRAATGASNSVRQRSSTGTASKASTNPQPNQLWKESATIGQPRIPRRPTRKYAKERRMRLPCAPRAC